MPMGPFTIGDRFSGSLARGLTNNSTSTSFSDPVPTTTEPESVDSTTATSNVLVINGGRRWLCLAPFGIGSDTNTFVFKVWGWNKVTATGTTALWVPFLLSKITATLGPATANGVASAAVINTEYFADTITEASDPNAIETTMFTGEGESVPMMVIVETAGFQLLEITFDLTGATSANVAWRLM